MHRGLYGGAIFIDLDVQYVDISNLRQVPDNQEVFVSNNDASSIIIEILEPSQENANDAISMHLKNLAEENESQYKNVLPITDLTLGESSLHEIATMAALSAIMIDSNKEIPITMLLIKLSSMADILISINNNKNSESIIDSIISSFKVVDWNLFKENDKK